MGTEAQANLPIEARPIVTAGFKWAPLKLPTAYTATVTPNPQPAVMTIHPAFWPLVLLSTTLATTPSPRMISSMVPSSSARKGGIRSIGKRRSYQRGRALSRKRTSLASSLDARLARSASRQTSIDQQSRRPHRPLPALSPPLVGARGIDVRAVGPGGASKPLLETRAKPLTATTPAIGRSPNYSSTAPRLI